MIRSRFFLSSYNMIYAELDVRLLLGRRVTAIAAGETPVAKKNRKNTC